MLCETTKHRPNCACRELINIYGGGIYKCGRPGCMAYRAGFDTRSQRVEHMQKHTRPFKCKHSGCSFAALGFVKETDLESHLANAHSGILHTGSAATQGQMNKSSQDDSELKAILIDAVQENDLSRIRSEATAVRKYILDLLLQAYQGRSSDTMIKHLLGEIPPELPQMSKKDRNEICGKIFRASTAHGNYDVFQMPCKLFNEWAKGISGDGFKLPKNHTLPLIGSARRADLLEIVVSNICETKGEDMDKVDYRLKEVLTPVIPETPDTLAEIMALECLERVKLRLSTKLLNRLLLEVARACFSIAIAEFLLAEGADVNSASGAMRPLLSAAKQDSLEAAKFMEFLLRKGANPKPPQSLRSNLDGLPGPRNIQKWIGITWEELVKQNTLSV